jgi:hypothetical protein
LLPLHLLWWELLIVTIVVSILKKLTPRELVSRPLALEIWNCKLQAFIVVAVTNSYYF